MVGRGEITDKAWERMAPLLPENGQRGGQWQDHRKVVNGILWKLRTGAPWRSSRALRSLADLPRPIGEMEERRYLGSLVGARPNQVGCYWRSGVGCEAGLKRSSCSPACRRSPHPSERRRRKKGVIHPEDEALGYSRGGFSSKLHLSCDWKGRPLSIEVTAGQRNESTHLEALLESIPLKLPEHLLADRSYSHEICRESL
jgi:hypothetical protein